MRQAHASSKRRYPPQRSVNSLHRCDAVLEAIARLTKQHLRPPTLNEIAADLGYSRSSVFWQVCHLRERGLVQDSGHKPGIRLADHPLVARDDTVVALATHRMHWCFICRSAAKVDSNTPVTLTCSCGREMVETKP